MWNYLTEKFISEYFLYDAVIGDDAVEPAFFELLGDIFLLSDDEKIFACKLIKSGYIAEIKTESDYMRYQRSKKYFNMTGILTDISADEEIAITLKGAAIETAKAIGCASPSALTKLKIKENLTTGAAGGNIAAMRLMGLMLCEGVFFTRDSAGGLYLRMAADWNDVPSLLYSLYYDKIYTCRYLEKLGFLLKSASQSEVLSIIREKYGNAEGCGHREAKLLERLFQLGVLKRGTYSAPHARALFSRAISYKDKEKLLYTAGRDCMSQIGDLPLKLGGADLAVFDYTVFKNIPLAREDERLSIITRLNNSDLRGAYSYRPLCISSDSVYLLHMYADVISGCAKDAHTDYINVSDLDISRFDHSKNNIFIRSCDEDKDNIYLMFFTGDIPGAVAEQAKGFLRSDGRSRFNLNMPNISINLSYILPICFCDLNNEKNLREACDVIRIAECSNEEKPCVLQFILDEKSRAYGIPEIVVQDKLKEKLLELDIDDMEKELDIEVRGSRKKGEKLLLTEQNYTLSQGLGKGSRYGFGGYKQ